MTTVTINLSDDELSIVRQNAAKHGFVGVEAYLRELVTEHISNEAEDDLAPPDDLRVTSREQLDSLIREGLEGEATPMTKEDFAQMRQELAARYGGGVGE